MVDPDVAGVAAGRGTQQGRGGLGMAEARQGPAQQDGRRRRQTGRLGGRRQRHAAPRPAACGPRPAGWCAAGRDMAPGRTAAPPPAAFSRRRSADPPRGVRPTSRRGTPTPRSRSPAAAAPAGGRTRPAAGRRGPAPLRGRRRHTRRRCPRRRRPADWPGPRPAPDAAGRLARPRPDRPAPRRAGPRHPAPGPRRAPALPKRPATRRDRPPRGPPGRAAPGPRPAPAPNLAARCCRCWSRYVAPSPPAVTSASSEAASPTWNRRARRSTRARSLASAAVCTASSARADSAARATSAVRSRSCTPPRYAVTRPATAPALRGRSSASRARQSLAMAISSASAPQASSRAVASARSPSAALRRISPEDRPRNAGSPVRTSHRIEPSANTSDRSSTRSPSPLACSGAMYAGVPIADPGRDRPGHPTRCSRWR